MAQNFKNLSLVYSVSLSSFLYKKATILKNTPVIKINFESDFGIDFPLPEISVQPRIITMRNDRCPVCGIVHSSEFRNPGVRLARRL